MSKTDICRAYHLYMINIIKDTDKIEDSQYLKLLKKLDTKIFVPMHVRDEQRVADAFRFRENYCYYTYGVTDAAEVIAEACEGSCSILELMIALSDRCETDIMSDYNEGDRTALWFWSMVGSLGLTKYTNKNYSDYAVDDILERFIRREYEPNGAGGLVTIEGATDMRSLDIWSQMMRFLNNVISG